MAMMPSLSSPSRLRGRRRDEPRAAASRRRRYVAMALGPNTAVHARRSVSSRRSHPESVLMRTGRTTMRVHMEGRPDRLGADVGATGGRCSGPSRSGRIDDVVRRSATLVKRVERRRTSGVRRPSAPLSAFGQPPSEARRLKPEAWRRSSRRSVVRRFDPDDHAYERA